MVDKAACLYKINAKLLHEVKHIHIVAVRECRVDVFVIASPVCMLVVCVGEFGKRHVIVMLRMWFAYWAHVEQEVVRRPEIQEVQAGGMMNMALQEKQQARSPLLPPYDPHGQQ